MTNLAVAKAGRQSAWLSRHGNSGDNPMKSGASWSPPPASLPECPLSSSLKSYATDQPNPFHDTLANRQNPQLQTAEDQRIDDASHPYSLRSPQVEALRQTLLNHQQAGFFVKSEDSSTRNMTPYPNTLSDPLQLSSPSSLLPFNARLSPNPQFFSAFSSLHGVETSGRKLSLSPLSSRSSSSADFSEMLAFPASPPLPNTSVLTSRSSLGVPGFGLSHRDGGMTFAQARSRLPQGNSNEDQTKPSSSLLDGPRLMRDAPNSELVIPSNCSEIMRSMAAKYNFNKIGTQGSSSVRGLPPLFCGRPARPDIPALKPVPSFLPNTLNTLDLLHRLPCTNSSVCDESNATSSSGLVLPQATPALSSPLHFPVTSGHSLSSAQMLINMVKKVSNLQYHRNQMKSVESHGPSSSYYGSNGVGDRTHVTAMSMSPFSSADAVSSTSSYTSALPSLAQKRSAEFSPLDLSPTHSHCKRARLDSEDVDVEGDDRSEVSVSEERSSPGITEEKSVGGMTSEAGAAVGSSPIAESNLSIPDDPQKWTVNDVYNFVKSIDICSEYADTFRDQRIDGCGLSLLTEGHLTSSLEMKLGPALKLMALLECRTSRSVTGYSECKNETDAGGSCWAGNVNVDASDVSNGDAHGGDDCKSNYSSGSSDSENYNGDVDRFGCSNSKESGSKNEFTTN